MRRIKNFAAMMLVAVAASMSAQTAMAADGIIMTERAGIVMSDSVQGADTLDIAGEIGSVLMLMGPGIVMSD